MWSEEFLSRPHPESFTVPTGFQDLVGRENSNARTRALECYKVGLLKEPLVNARDAEREIIPTGWADIQSGVSVHSRLGYFAYSIGKAIQNDNQTRLIDKSFSALCALFVIQMGFSYKGKTILYVALFEKLQQCFPCPKNVDRTRWLRLLSAGMFSTIKSNRIAYLLEPYLHSQRISTIFFIWENGTEIQVTPENFSEFATRGESLTDIKPKKHSLFWIGSDSSSRGVYSNAAKYFEAFIREIASIEWSSLDVQDNPLKFLIKKNNDQSPCIFENLKSIENDYPQLKPFNQSVMKSLLEGVKESLQYLTTIGADNRSALQPQNEIYYGPPGTGKSFLIEQKLSLIPETHKERVTFHPEFDHSSFVGSYRPITEKNSRGEDEIKYKFSPQAFTNIYVNAWSNETQDFYLIIEEINRGNCAEIFGDVFQLLDRNSNYAISPSLELKQYLESTLGSGHKGIKDGKMRLPPNLRIMATMNTSDQSLFPMDTAFKRRWTWKYVPIEYSREPKNNKSAAFKVDLGNGFHFMWLDFIEKVNKHYIKPNPNLGDDKCVGNYFVNPEDDVISLEEFINKVIFYLWSDVFREEEETIFDDDITYQDFFPIFPDGQILIEQLCRSVNIELYSN